MNKHKDKLARLPTTTPNMFIDVEVSYDKGGANYFSGGHDRRGYSIFVMPIEDRGDGSVRWIIGDGLRAFVQEAARFNPKELTRVRCRALDLPAKNGHGSLVKELVDQVAKRKGLELVPNAWLEEMNKASERMSQHA